MSLARIKQQAEQADQMIKGLNEPEESADQQPEENQEDVTEQHTSELPESDQGVESEDTAPVGEDVDKLRKEAETWEQRYRSLDGMIRARDKQIQQLHDLLAGMQQQPQQPQESSDDAGPIITKKDEDDFGSELVDMARRAAREEFRSLKSDILKEVKELRDNLKGVNEVTQVTAQDRFEMKLDSLTDKRWRVLDTDQSFIDWLTSSTSRHKVFTTAVQGQDATTVADFFNDYAEMANQQRAQAEVPKQSRKAEIEKQVSPGKSKSVGTPSSQAGGKKVWTKTEIAQAYANKKQYKADEFQQMEREIAAAQREGRVNYAA